MPHNTTPIPQLEHKLLNLVPNELVLIDSSFKICWYNNTFENNRIKPAHSHNQDELKSWLKNLLQSLFIEAWNFEKMHFEAILSQFPGIVNEPIDLSISKICQDQSEYLLISIIKSEALLSYSMKLNEYGAKYKALLDSAVDGIVIINHKGLIEVMNPAALRLFGYVKDEIKGQNISVLMNNPHKTNHDQYIQRFQTTGEKKIIGIGREVEGKRKDGQCFPFWLSVSEIKHLNETSFAGIIHDLTAQKEVEAKLKKYTHELESKVAKRTYELQVANNELKLEIDQKMAYEEALELSQNLYRTISRNFPNGTIMCLPKAKHFLSLELPAKSL
jgi:PAS domain S-box-containing protein